MAVAAALAGRQAAGDSIILNPSKDNTLIEGPGPTYNSNGAGESIFCGRTGFFAEFIRLRAVFAFDVSAIPPGSTISGALLTMQLEQTVSGAQDHVLHKLLADWGEGASFAPGGSGALAEPDDATWVHRFFPDVFWTSPGGDYAAAVSALQSVSVAGVDYTWTSLPLAADVQAWVNDPCSNFGWIMIGNENFNNSAKRFASREAAIPEIRPRLAITFTPALTCVGDVTFNGVVNIDDLLSVITAWGPCATACNCFADIDRNNTVNIDDLLAVITGWGACN